MTSYEEYMYHWAQRMEGLAKDILVELKTMNLLIDASVEDPQTIISEGERNYRNTCGNE